MNWTEEELAAFMARRAERGTKFKPPIVTNSIPFKLPPNEAGEFALGRLPTGQMNKTEAAYAEYLELQKHSGEILWYKFEGIKLRLADNTFLTVDFAVLPKSGVLEMREVKGGWFRDDAKVKLKVAASIYPFKFIVVRKRKGGWDCEEFS